MEFQPFYIEKQESLATDKFTKNGRTVDLHIVAKNIAFVIHVASSFDLNSSPLTAKLVYDFDRVEDEKDVEALKCAPLEHTAHVDETGHKAAVEAKIGVLSSQHEGAYFRVKFSAVDPITQVVLEEFSQPIKVISKRNQVKKMMERKQIPKNLELSSAILPISASSSTNIVGTKRPASSDPVVSEVLLRMEQQQREQLQLLQQLVQAQNSSSSSSKDAQPIKQRVDIPDPDDIDFETAFTTFLKAYTKIPQEERSTKIRKVLKKTSNTNNLENLSEFIGIYSGSQTNNSDSVKTCQCQDCPHKEFSRLDTFYHDFLSDPLSPEMV